MIKNRKRTKIVATLGPACDTKEIIENMMEAGVNVFRVNFSHADHADVEEKIKIIREINVRRVFNVAVLADLQGPKLRVGVMKDGVFLNIGDTFTFTTEKCEGTQEKAFMTYQKFPKDVQVGEHILVDDGKLLFEVTATDRDTQVTTKVLRGGILNSKKGVNLPKTKISLPALTKKDIADALFAIADGVAARQQRDDLVCAGFKRACDTAWRIGRNILRCPIVELQRLFADLAIHPIRRVITARAGLDWLVTDPMRGVAAQYLAGARVERVERRDQLPRGTEVGVQRERAGRAVTRFQVSIDVAAAEAIDRLLGIADHHQATAIRAFVVAIDAIKDRVLQRVRVLELVHHRDRPCLEQVIGEDAAAWRQCAVHALDELVEGELAGGGKTLLRTCAQLVAVTRKRKPF